MIVSYAATYAFDDTHQIKNIVLSNRKLAIMLNEYHSVI